MPSIDKPSGEAQKLTATIDTNVVISSPSEWSNLQAALQMPGVDVNGAVLSLPLILLLHAICNLFYAVEDDSTLISMKKYMLSLETKLLAVKQAQSPALSRLDPKHAKMINKVLSTIASEPILPADGSTTEKRCALFISVGRVPEQKSKLPSMTGAISKVVERRETPSISPKTSTVELSKQVETHVKLLKSTTEEVDSNDKTLQTIVFDFWPKSEPPPAPDGTRLVARWFTPIRYLFNNLGQKVSATSATVEVSTNVAQDTKTVFKDVNKEVVKEVVKVTSEISREQWNELKKRYDSAKGQIEIMMKTCADYKQRWEDSVKGSAGYQIEIQSLQAKCEELSKKHETLQTVSTTSLVEVEVHKNNHQNAVEEHKKQITKERIDYGQIIEDKRRQIAELEKTSEELDIKVTELLKTQETRETQFGVERKILQDKVAALQVSLSAKSLEIRVLKRDLELQTTRVTEFETMQVEFTKQESKYKMLQKEIETLRATWHPPDVHQANVEKAVKKTTEEHQAVITKVRTELETATKAQSSVEPQLASLKAALEKVKSDLEVAMKERLRSDREANLEKQLKMAQARVESLREAFKKVDGIAHERLQSSAGVNGNGATTTEVTVSTSGTTVTGPELKVAL